MNYTNDENCCFIVIKRPYDNDNNRNFPQEMMFKNDNRFGYDDRYDNWNDFDGKDCDNFDHDRRPQHNDCWKCNCRKCNERKCDHNNNDRPNKRRCGFFNFIRFC